MKKGTVKRTATKRRWTAAREKGAAARERGKSGDVAGLKRIPVMRV